MSEKVEVLKEAILALIEVVIEYLNQLPETTWEDFEKRKQQINKLEEMKRKINK